MWRDVVALRGPVVRWLRYGTTVTLDSAVRLQGYWISKLDRMTSVFELAALQGVPRCVLDRMLATSQSTRAVGAAIGDAMSINVLMRVLNRALYEAGLVKAPVQDIWACSSKVAGRMPDALYAKHGLLEKLR